MLLQIHVCLLSGLIFLSLLEKRPLRIANSDNLPETVTGWGWEYSAPGIFQPYLKTLHHLLFSCSYWYVIFSFIRVQIQNDRCRRAKKNKRNQFVIFSPSLLDSKQTQTYFCKCCFFYRSLSVGWLFLKLKSDILFVMSPCSPAVTSPQCLHSRYYFWLSPLHLGAQWSLFHFLCHNAIAKISLRGITLLETRITYVVSQTHPSSPYPTGADDQWVCQCQGLGTKREGRRKKRVFWKHVTLTIIHLQSEEQNNMNPPYQNPEEEP